MGAGNHQHAAQHGVERRHPQMPPVDQSFGGDDLDRVAFQGQDRAVEGSRHHDVGQGQRAQRVQLRTQAASLSWTLPFDGGDGRQGWGPDQRPS